MLTPQLIDFILNMLLLSLQSSSSSICFDALRGGATHSDTLVVSQWSGSSSHIRLCLFFLMLKGRCLIHRNIWQRYHAGVVCHRFWLEAIVYVGVKIFDVLVLVTYFANVFAVEADVQLQGRFTLSLISKLTSFRRSRFFLVVNTCFRATFGLLNLFGARQLGG